MRNATSFSAPRRAGIATACSTLRSLAARLTPRAAYLAPALALALVAAPACKAGADSPSQKVEAKAPVAEPPAPAQPKLTPFDGPRAFEHVRKLVDLGPHPSGSKQIVAARKYIEDELKSYGLTVSEQSFTADTPVGKLAMTNVIAEIPGTEPGVVIVSSHFDTKRTPPNFVGANDGGSSTGALLEIARVMAEQSKGQKPRFTTQFVFFDGEEATIDWTDTDSVYGSRHYVAELQKAGKTDTIRAMILLDMIGDKDLNIPREGNSTPELTSIIWQTAASLGYAKQFPNQTIYIEDDHIPFRQAGIAAVDLIDFTYGTDAKNPGPGGPNNAYWHTAADTLDKLSPESLKAVGDTIVASLPKIMAALR